jgi:hypothetical protein
VVVLGLVEWGDGVITEHRLLHFCMEIRVGLSLTSRRVAQVPLPQISISWRSK